MDILDLNNMLRFCLWHQQLLWFFLNSCNVNANKYFILKLRNSEVRKRIAFLYTFIHVLTFSLCWWLVLKKSSSYFLPLSQTETPMAKNIRDQESEVNRQHQQTSKILTKNCVVSQKKLKAIFQIRSMEAQKL